MSRQRRIQRFLAVLGCNPHALSFRLLAQIVDDVDQLEGVASKRRLENSRCR